MGLITVILYGLKLLDVVPPTFSEAVSLTLQGTLLNIVPSVFSGTPIFTLMTKNNYRAILYTKLR
jgi:hypothetical protein